MSTSRKFHAFGELPIEVRFNIYEASDKETLLRMAWTNRDIHNEVLDFIFTELSLVGTPGEISRKLRNLIIAPQGTRSLRLILSAVRVFTMGVIKVTNNSWEGFGSNWAVSQPTTITSHLLAVLGEAPVLRVLSLDLHGLDAENLRKLSQYATPKFLPPTLRSLRLHGCDESIGLIVRGLQDNQLESLALLGLSSYTKFETLLAKQKKTKEYELGCTERPGVLVNLHAACSSGVFVCAQSLSFTVPTQRNGDLAEALQDNLKRLKYLSIVSPGSPGDTHVKDLIKSYFTEIKKLKYLVVKLDYPTAVLAERLEGGVVHMRRVHDLDSIAWPMLARITNKYPRKPRLEG